MFDIGFSELVVIAVITLVVVGPERLPETVRSISLWIGRIKQMFSTAQKDLENEVGMDDIRRQLYNEKIMRDISDSKTDIDNVIASAKVDVNSILPSDSMKLGGDIGSSKDAKND